jgi:hypothetical protein
MPRKLIVALGALLVFAFAAAHVSTARADGVATVSPASGSLYVQYTFSVSGLTPGNTVSIDLYDGAGTRFTYQKNGVDQVFVVGDDGTVSVSIVPATDLDNPVSGTWRAVFQEQETGANVTIQFEVTDG